MNNNFHKTQLGDCPADDVCRTMERLTQYLIELPSRNVTMEWRAGQISQLVNDLPEAGDGIEATLDFF